MKSRTYKLPDELIERLQKQAADNRRSMSEELRIALEKHLK